MGADTGVDSLERILGSGFSGADTSHVICLSQSDVLNLDQDDLVSAPA